MLPLLLVGLGMLAAARSASASAPRAGARPGARPGAAPAPSSAKLAARALWRFLDSTGRFGSATDRPVEVVTAQRALGVKPDGIVGPLTRAAAQAVGITLPARGRTSSASSPSSAQPPTKLTIEHPADSGASAEEQAAIDAAVSEAIRQSTRQPIDATVVAPQAPANPEYALPGPPSSSAHVPPPFPSSSASSSAGAGPAAQKLLAFLIRTGRFGSAKDRPEEVREAQRAFGVKDDGIVGPSTRTAAKRAGVALPPRK